MGNSVYSQHHQHGWWRWLLYRIKQNMLSNKLDAVIANVEAGKNKDAANQLRNDIVPKMGSAENAEGDSVVWIIGRSSQQVWYQEARDVVKSLEMAR